MNKQARFKAAISFGITTTVFFLLKGFLTQDILTTKRVLVMLFSGGLVGALAGLSLWWLAGLLAKSKLMTQSTRVNIDPDERILFETPANHLKGTDDLVGNLHLTNRRLIYTSNQLKNQNHPCSINLSDIKHVDRFRTSGILNNGLSITSKSANTEKFAVEEVEEWVKLLTTKHSL